MIEWIHNIDTTIIQWMAKHTGIFFIDNIMIFFTSLGNKGFLWISLILLLWISKKYKTLGTLCALALILSSLLGLIFLKPLIHRPRPFLAFSDLNILISKPSSFSFPSGHTLIAFSVTCVFKEFIQPFYLGYIAIGIACLIGISRVYLMVHYPSDVFFGAILGIFCASIIIKYFKKFND